MSCDRLLELFERVRLFVYHFIETEVIEAPDGWVVGCHPFNNDVLSRHGSKVSNDPFERAKLSGA